jgi:hypothetical protein
VALTLAMLALVPGVALAGQASSGQLFFYPCTSCHPITDAQLAAGRTFPNGFKGHQITLVGHDALGHGEAACLTCHDDPSSNPGMLKTADGRLVSVTGDVSLVCYRCHSARYKQWKAGTHGRNEPSCTAKGCHDPHSPQWIYAPALMPYTGTGFQFQVLPTHVAFKPLMQAPATPWAQTPWWFVALVVMALVAVAVLAAALVAGGSRS